jgi:hypothetical protein
MEVLSGSQLSRDFEVALEAEAHVFPELYERYFVEIVVPLDDAMRSVIRRGKASGEIRVDVDETLLAKVLQLVRVGTSNCVSIEPHGERASQLIIDLVFDGVTTQ